MDFRISLVTPAQYIVEFDINDTLSLDFLDSSSLVVSDLAPTKPSPPALIYPKIHSAQLYH